MLSQALLAPPAVFQLPPPYEQFEAVPDPSALSPQELREAALLAVGVTAPEEAWAEVTALVPRLRSRFPAAPVVLRVGRGSDVAEAGLERRAGELRVRGVVYADEAPRQRLRRLMTQPLDLAGDVEEWLPLRLPELAPALVQLVGTIFRSSARYAEVGALLAGVDHAERTVRTWFRRGGIPGPGKWLAVAHAVRAALRLQAEDHAPLLALAVECGYSDHSSLSRQSLRLFGVRPGVIRRTLGWEWLVDRWLRRAAR